MSDPALVDCKASDKKDSIDKIASDIAFFICDERQIFAQQGMGSFEIYFSAAHDGNSIAINVLKQLPYKIDKQIAACKQYKGYVPPQISESANGVKQMIGEYFQNAGKIAEIATNP